MLPLDAYLDLHLYLFSLNLVFYFKTLSIFLDKIYKLSSKSRIVVFSIMMFLLILRLGE